MEDLLHLILTNIASQPDAIKITQENNTDTVAFTITADKADIGRIIGKNGKTIQAIRTLVKAIAAQEQMWVTIDIAEA